MLLMKSLSLRRLACVPWLLAVGLVLGWGGEAVADPRAETDEANHSGVKDHTHATDPYLVVRPKLSTDAANPAVDSVFVNWETSLSKNFHKTDLTATPPGNKTPATLYTVDLFKGEIPADPAGASTGTANHVGTGSYSGGTVDTREHTFTLDLELAGANTGPGFYWVRMQVQVHDGDGSSGDIETEYFTRQIAVTPDYELSVNPRSIREDADATNVTVSVRLKEGKAVDEDNDTDVQVQLITNQQGLNTRFRSTSTTLTIPAGQRTATGTIRFTPIDSDTTPDDDLLVTFRTLVGGGAVEGSTDIRLIDTDKLSTQIDLSFSPASLSKNDPTTSIVVTATLNGGRVRDDLALSLVVDEATTAAAGLVRDVDYSAVMGPLTIPDRRVSGRATITITPLNKKVGPIWVKAASNPTYTYTEGGNQLTQTVTVNPNSISLTDTPGASVKALTATPYSMREDAGAKEVTLEVTLDNPVSTDETVILTVDLDGSDLLGQKDARFKETVDAKRDIHYAFNPPSIFIPQGETTGKATATFTPVNNTDEDDTRTVTIVAMLKGVEVGRTGILITDDDSTSEQIKLTASPDEINENAGATTVTLTGTLQGSTFDDDLDVFLTIVTADVGNPATRDVDYTTVVPKLVIEGGETQGTVTFTITPIDNDGEDDNEIIRIDGLESQKPSIEDEFGDIQELNVGHVDITLRDSGAEAEADEDDGEDSTTPVDPTRPSFAVADSIDSQTYVVGTAIDPLVLPEARGGTAPLMYSVSTLPLGLAFDAATRTLSGTPTATTTGAANIIYTVIDSARAASVLIFTITVNEAEAAPPTAETGDAQLTATPSAVREDGGTTQVSLRVSLTAARDTDEVVTFTIVAPSEGTQAVRDVDYTATLGALVTIPKGSTVGTTTLALTPINNTTMDSLRAIGVQATFGSGGVLKTDIRIADDETPSTAISLSVSQDALTEDSAETSITVTATLNGGALTEAKNVILSIDASSTATRDVDYAALFNAIIAIPAGSITGTTQFAIRPVNDMEEEGSETIKLTATVSGLTGDEVVITLSDPGSMMDDSDDMDDPDDPDDPDDSALAFSNTVANQEYTVGTAITPLVLPEATGGTAPYTYTLSALPAGLSFDVATRTISGTPSAVTEGAVIIIYTVLDSGGTVKGLSFTITVNSGLTFGDIFDFFGSGKVVPTASHDLAEIREFIVGQRVEDIVLPEASGGTAPLTYSLSPALPAGLTFDAATRTIAGTPRAAAEAVYTYTVTDVNGATASLSLETLPTAFSLADNFPNPFNPATTIQYALPQAADVELTVYNVVGQPVRTLVAEHQSAGRYAVEWDATNDSGHSLSSGMYFYRLQVGGEFLEIKKMLLLK